MSNPVLNRMQDQWNATTPAGYPTMPGYEVGQGSQTLPPPASPLLRAARTTPLTSKPWSTPTRALRQTLLTAAK